MYDLRRVGGDDHLHVADAAYVPEVAPEHLLPGDVEGYLRLVQDDDGALGGVEEERVEHHEDLLLAGGQVLHLQRHAVVHGDADPAGVGDGYLLVEEDLVDHVLVDDYRLGEHVVAVDVVGDGAGQLLVPPPVLDDLVPRGRELLPGGNVGLEPGVLDEVELGLEVLAPELQVAVRHVRDALAGAGLQLPVLLGVADGLVQLLGEDGEDGGHVAVLPPDEHPVGRDVHGLDDLAHLLRGQRDLDLALGHLDYEVARVVLHYEGGAVLEAYVEPLEGRLPEVCHVPAEGGVDHPHERALAHAVGRVDEGQAAAQVDVVVELVEKPVHLDGRYLHGRPLMP